MSIESTHDVFVNINIPKHGVPEGGKEVVTQTFYKGVFEYGNAPREMVVAVQALGVEFLGKLVELGKEHAAQKKGPKAPRA